LFWLVTSEQDKKTEAVRQNPKPNSKTCSCCVNGIRSVPCLGSNLTKTVKTAEPRPCRESEAEVMLVKPKTWNKL